MADPDIDNQEKRDAGRERAAEEYTIKKIMAEYSGRQWMWSLLSFCAPYHARYLNDGDTTGAIFRDGRASVGAMLIDRIDQYAPQLYLQMVVEHRERLERAAEREKAKTNDPADESVPLTLLEKMADSQLQEQSPIKPATPPPQPKKRR